MTLDFKCGASTQSKVQIVCGEACRREACRVCIVNSSLQAGKSVVQTCKTITSEGIRVFLRPWTCLTRCVSFIVYNITHICHNA